ncbi:hypothetical protein GCK72_020255 [Caenorhabditis remanei]|uniref:Lin-15A/B-like domain-containing protein n=1 Tax=Caenorhabditis remanei TaxID=31234 RepID=A0A6A5GET3_CAERE|nr:hypothetical protein GCK72_020255 [Caenorhabditis remanei]KAF1753698.1 hypothetical protein GCK72_020255 [Caenorhabditis remanei]
MCELLSKFMITQGIPFENINSNSFRELLEHFEPDSVIPTEQSLRASLKRANEQVIDCGKGNSISVTIDITNGVEDQEEEYLVFSIHHFQDFYNRKATIFFEKLEIAQFNWTSLWSRIQNAFKSYTNFNTINVVCSSPELSEIFKSSENARNEYICFYHYMSKFCGDVLEIEKVNNSIGILEKFLEIVKSVPEVYECYLENQPMKNWDPKLPTLPADRKSWQSMLHFMTRCLEMDPTFRMLSDKWNIENYITTEEFNDLLCAQRVLTECNKCTQELSDSKSTISQVIPAISKIHLFLSSDKDFEVQNGDLGMEIKKLFAATFSTLTTEDVSERYNSATLLDPRYAFRNDIHPTATWTSIARKLESEMAEEISTYRRICRDERPTDNENPFSWWALRQDRMPLLAEKARGFLSCPAVTIDSGFFFGAGGKFSHICKAYSKNNNVDWMKYAGLEQQFRGRGTEFEYKGEGFTRPILAFRESDDEPPFKKSKMRDIPIFKKPPGEQNTVYDYLSTRVKWKPRNYKPREVLSNAALKNVFAVKEKSRETSEEDLQLKGEVKPEPFDIFGGMYNTEDSWNAMDPDEKTEEIDPCLLHFPDYSDSPSTSEQAMANVGYKKQCNRRCILCSRLRNHLAAKNVTIIGEKLLMGIAAINTGRVSQNHAKMVYSRRKKTFFCREHYGETVKELMKILNCKHVDDISTCSMAPIQPICDVVTEGNVDLSDNNFRAFFIHFVQKQIIEKQGLLYKNGQTTNGIELTGLMDIL